MTTANKVTIIRILLIPFFIVQILYYFRTGDELQRMLGLISFAVAAILDGVDGYIARHYNQKSELGAMLDPLADKLLLVSGIVLLSFTIYHDQLPNIPLWLTAAIISRDVLLLLGWAIIHLTCGKVTVRPRILGKMATVFQMATVLWILLKWKESVLPYLFWGALICTAGSGLLYVWDGMKQLSASPSSSAKLEQ